MKAEAAATLSVDDVCAREPIHLAGSIQPHGHLFVADHRTWKVSTVSRNVQTLVGGPAASVIGRPLADVLALFTPTVKEDALRSAGRTPVYLDTVTLRSAGGAGAPLRFHVVAHSCPSGVVIEFEDAGPDGEVAFQGHYLALRPFLSELEEKRSIEETCQLTAREVRKLTGFDRVLVYRFDDGWNGTVIAEDRNDALPKYLGLSFPASDVPAQARALYRQNRMRLIADSEFEPVPLEPPCDDRSGAPLDLSFSTLRSISPYHVEYMRNMGTRASMSVSVLREGELWGLISCHHSSPRMVPIDVRIVADLIGQVLSLQVSARVRESEQEARVKYRSVLSRLLSAMAAGDDFVGRLTASTPDLLSLVGADGALVVSGDRTALVGDHPPEDDIPRLLDLVAAEEKEVWHTDALPALLPSAEAYKARACGVLAVSVSKLHRSYIIWFRREFRKIIDWGGDPGKSLSAGPTPSPRASFAKWEQAVAGTSAPWLAVEAEAAAEFRNAVVGVVLRKAEEMAELSEELERSNKELEAFSYSVSHDLRSPIRHLVGYAELLLDEDGERLSPTSKRYVGTIIESARFAGQLVDNLLLFSQMGRHSLNKVAVDLEILLAEIRREMETDLAGRPIEWKVGPLAPAYGDPVMLRLCLTNLVSNAVKYSRGRDPAVIEVGTRSSAKETVVFVRDNGVGFDMKYVEKLFGVFQRLHRMEEFEGTGIGLATVRRLVARHGGRTWAEGKPGEGATFFMALPVAAQ